MTIVAWNQNSFVTRWSGFLFLYKHTGCPYYRIRNVEYMDSKDFDYTILPSTILCGKVRQNSEVSINVIFYSQKPLLLDPCRLPVIPPCNAKIAYIPHILSNFITSPYIFSFLSLAHDHDNSYYLTLKYVRRLYIIGTSSYLRLFCIIYSLSLSSSSLSSSL